MSRQDTPLLHIGFGGFGIWARGLQGASQFVQAMDSGFADIGQAEFVAPKPEAVPAKERRRAGLMINLAVQVAHEACDNAGVDKGTIPSVFASALGDTAITDYMCRKLAQPEKLLSPTKFHNSVHNAPSGYWTISAGNHAPSSFVGGFRESFGAGLLEAASQAHALQSPVLLVAYDIANSAPFVDIEPVAETLGVALVVLPTGLPANSTGASPKIASAELYWHMEGSNGEASRSAPRAAALQQRALQNPIGDSLALLERLASGTTGSGTLHVAAAPAAALEIAFD